MEDVAQLANVAGGTLVGKIAAVEDCRWLIRKR
jgi:hypothetical protein